ncbi:MAG: YCF48-related protein [Ignavibacteriaceae bacterium]
MKLIILYLFMVMSATVVFSQDFTLLNPKAGFEHFKSVHFESNLLGFACGNNGSIYKTTNAGDSWTKQVSSTALTLYSIYFVDTQIGFAISGEVAGNSLVLKTINGGSTWNPITTGAVGVLYSVFFINSSTGWIGGQDGVLYKTTDTGESWTEQTSNMVKIKRTGDQNDYTDEITDYFDIYSIYFSSTTTGYVVGEAGRICVTANGGITWEMKNPTSEWAWEATGEQKCIYVDPETGECLEYEDVYGWVETTSSPAGVNNFNSISGYSLNVFALTSGNLYVSGDEGASWELSWAHGGNSIYFIDDVIGFIANDYAINKTTNGGGTWTGKVNGSGGYNKNYSSVFCTSENDAFAVGENGRIISTTNGGTDWNVISGATLSFYGIDMLNSNTGYISGSDTDADNLFAIIRKTTDGGLSWKLNKDFSDSKTLYSIDFVDNNVGFAVGVNNDNSLGFIAKTINAGVDWTSSTNAQVSCLNSVFFTNATTGFAVGHLNWTDGKILYTSDGGANWSLIKTIDGKWLKSIYFLDEQNGFVVGNGANDIGYFLKTTDGGTNWSTPVQVSYSGRYLNSVYFISTSIGFTAGYGGVIYKTTDGGATWNPPAVNPSTKELNDIKFYDNNNGYIVGYNGEFLHTTDGGNNWTKLETNLTQNLMAVSIAGDELWTCGESSVILKNSPSFPLSVELSSFAANICGSHVILNWQTATEVNNYGFEIERSQTSNVKSETWEKIGFVEGFGNSNSPKHYTYTDENLANGKYLYRLKQLDNDGNFTYSAEIEVLVNQIPTEFALYQNYPNPFNPNTIIKFGLPDYSKVMLEIYNIIGEKVVTLVDNEMVAGNHEIIYTAGNLSSGVYYLTMSAVSVNGNGNFKQTKKILLIK